MQSIDMSDCGRRLLPTFIDQVASDDPGLVFVQIPKTLHVQDGLRTVTFQDLARAIDKCAWWINCNLGTGHNFPTVAYIGPHDLRYLFLAIGACKAGFKMFFASPRNSTQTLLSLLDAVNCSVFLTPNASKVPKNLQETMAGRSMDLFDFPELSYFLNDTQSTPAFLWRKTFDKAQHDPLAVFHTSGSTVTPKAIVINHGAVASLDAFRKISLMSGTMVQTSYHVGRTSLLLFPMFHASALATLFLSIWYQIPTILPPPVPLTADLANEMLVHYRPEVSIMPLSILVDLAANPKFLKNLLKCHHVQYGGGPIPTETGNLIAAATRLITVFGSSETGFFPLEVNKQTDWAYVKLSPYVGGRFRQYTKELHELIIVRDGNLVEFQAIFWTYPQLYEYHTKDLFSKHPSKPDLWLWQGRIDDMIVLGNGEKFNPTAMETIINGHPTVDAALVCGQGRTQCALLLELSSQSNIDRQNDSLLEDLWPIIPKAHMDCPEYALLTKEMILFIGPGKKMIRADKGTVRRKMTIENFASELDALYRSAEEQSMTTSNVVDSFNIKVIEDAVLGIVRDTPKFTDITVDEDFFKRGLNSLHAMTISRRIKATFPNAPVQITNKDVYDFPSVRRLAQFVSGLDTGNEDTTKLLQKTYDRYLFMLPNAVSNSGGAPTEARTVLLTGSTGNFGSCLLDQLFRDDGVDIVYCLNRNSNAENRQQKSRSIHNLPIFPKPVVFIQADYSLPRLGIPNSIYATLQANVTHIIHSAWPVDILLPISSFEPSIKSVVDLVELSSSSVNLPPITFISSVGAVFNQPSASPVPERPFSDWHVAGQTGYTQSKLIAERLLNTASSNLGLDTTICRVCQLAGRSDQSSSWPEKEWLPTMMETSKHLGAIPQDLGALDKVTWLPVDAAAAVIHDLVFRNTGKASKVFHVVNPNTVHWKDVIHTTTAYAKLKRIPLLDWIELLKQSTETDDTESTPASKFVDFLEGISGGDSAPDFDTTEAMTASATLAKASPITHTMMGKCFGDGAERKD